MKKSQYLNTFHVNVQPIKNGTVQREEFQKVIGTYTTFKYISLLKFN